MDRAEIKARITEIEVDFLSVYTYIKQFPTNGIWIDFQKKFQKTALDEISAVQRKLTNLKDGIDADNVPYPFESMISCLDKIYKYVSKAPKYTQPDIQMMANITLTALCDQFMHLVSVVKTSGDKSASNIAFINEKLEKILSILQNYNKSD